RLDSDLRDAAIDKQLSPVDEAAVVRGEEYRRLGNLFHPANTSQWNEAAKVSHEPFAVLGRHQSFEPRCADGAGTEYIDPDLPGLQVQYPGPRKIADCS